MITTCVKLRTVGDVEVTSSAMTTPAGIVDLLNVGVQGSDLALLATFSASPTIYQHLTLDPMAGRLPPALLVGSGAVTISILFTGG